MGGMTEMPARKPDKIVTVTRPMRVTAGATTIEVDRSKRGRLILKIWVDANHIRIEKLDSVCKTPDCSFALHDR